MSACVWDDRDSLGFPKEGIPQPYHHGNPIAHPLGTGGVGPGRCKAGDSNCRTQTSASTRKHGSGVCLDLTVRSTVVPPGPTFLEHYRLLHTVILSSLPCLSLRSQTAAGQSTATSCVSFATPWYASQPHGGQWEFLVLDL